MNLFSLIYCRTYQFVLNKIVAPFLNIKEPKLIENDNSLIDSYTLYKNHSLNKPFIFVTKSISKSESFKSLIDNFDKNKMNYFIFNDIKPDPTKKAVESCYQLFNDNKCDSILSIGGGSCLDLAKAVGILITNKNKNISKYRGLLKVKKSLPFFVAVPTTAGTGSETTICSVITDEEKNDKYAINDPKLIPNYAILDSNLLKTLPKMVISTTGMDALTHAIEAYLGNALTKKTEKYSLEAIKLIHDNLLNFYEDSNNDIARKNMLKASYLAGVSFTRSYVGYVHALAHAIGGKYHISHGLANSTLLPYVLEKYGKKAYKKLANISDYLNLTNNKADRESKANATIKWIKDLIVKLELPNRFYFDIKQKDLPFLVNHAYKEATPLYPVCKELTKKELEEILIESDFSLSLLLNNQSKK